MVSLIMRGCRGIPKKTPAPYASLSCFTHMFYSYPFCVAVKNRQILSQLNGIEKHRFKGYPI